MSLPTSIRWTCLLAVVGLMAGCSGRASVLPNPDPALRKSSAQLAADAAKRSPYKSEAPRGGEAAARAQVGYWADRLEVANLSDSDWENVEVWVNRKYVCYIPKVPSKGPVEVLFFQMLYDDAGNSFPTNNNNTRVESVEVFMDGKMFDVKTALAD